MMTELGLEPIAELRDSVKANGKLEEDQENSFLLPESLLGAPQSPA